MCKNPHEGAAAGLSPALSLLRVPALLWLLLACLSAYVADRASLVGCRKGEGRMSQLMSVCIATASVIAGWFTNLAVGAVSG